MLTLTLAILAISFLGTDSLKADDGNQQPNILWLTSEDNGPHLGCYGDDYADTPHIDSIAKKGMIYLNAWSTAPVCAPARTTLITGVYPPSTGSQHMRSLVNLPSFMKMYPQFLREKGYYCTNNRKEDYNAEKPGKVWDESGPRAHWNKRPEGKPFFAVFNYTVSHESQLRIRPHKAVHDPAKVHIPAYHPNAPEIRQDWAQYYDKITEMDQLVGEALAELEEAGLAEETIIFYYGDHGSGMPRNKRWLYQSGLRVPLVVYFPEKFKHLAPKDYNKGGESEQLVGFIDYAPTLLSIAGIKPPEYMQGHSFAGKYPEQQQEYMFGFRGRMDERYDMSRTVRDKRYHYIRNYMPHRPQGQYLAYMFQTPTTRKWKQLFDEGKLNEAQSFFWKSKPAEELYDLENDPEEIHNLASSPEHQQIKDRLKNELKKQIFQIRDLGFVSEAEMHIRSEGSTPYEFGHNPKLYPLKRIYPAAELATSLNPDTIPQLVKMLDDKEPAIRYWAAIGLLNQAQKGYDDASVTLLQHLDDPSPSVQIVVAESLCRYGSEKEFMQATDRLLDLANFNNHNFYESLAAMNVLVYFNEKLKDHEQDIKQLPGVNRSMNQRINNYVDRMKIKILADFEENRSR